MSFEDYKTKIITRFIFQ